MNDQTVSFNVNVAMAVGPNAAVVFEAINASYVRSMPDRAVTQYGSHWVQLSLAEIASSLPFLSAKQVRTSINKLKKAGYIKAVYNGAEPLNRTRLFRPINVQNLVQS